VTLKTLLVISVLAAAPSIFAQAPGKIGLVHIQNAIIQTKDGQKAAQALQAKFDPKRKALEQKQSEIATKQQELSKGSNTMAETRRTQLTRDIDSLQKSLQRESEDVQAELEQDQNKILNELGQKLLVVLDKYGRDNGYALVLDVSSPQTPVLFAANGIDITREIVDLYDKNAPPAPSPGTASAPAPIPVPAAKKTPAAK
jgi:outer membrane protein